MKRILSTVVALSVAAVATQAQAADFILSNNTGNDYWANFRLNILTGTGVSASLHNEIGVNPSFTDNYFFAPVFTSIGSGAAIATTFTDLHFTLPTGLSITGYALTPAVQAALQAAFTTADESVYLDAIDDINAVLAGLPVLYTQSSVGGTDSQQTLENVPLGLGNFYKITITGSGASELSAYDGNLAATSIPEPATWAMMLAGFGAIGFAMRRQRKPQPKVRFAF